MTFTWRASTFYSSTLYTVPFSSLNGLSAVYTLELGVLRVSPTKVIHGTASRCAVFLLFIRVSILVFIYQSWRTAFLRVQAVVKKWESTTLRIHRKKTCAYQQSLHCRDAHWIATQLRKVGKRKLKKHDNETDFSIFVLKSAFLFVFLIKISCWYKCILLGTA